MCAKVITVSKRRRARIQNLKTGRGESVGGTANTQSDEEIWPHFSEKVKPRKDL